MQQTAYYTKNFPGVKTPQNYTGALLPCLWEGVGAEIKGGKGTKQGRKGKEGGAQTGWGGRRV